MMNYKSFASGAMAALQIDCQATVVETVKTVSLSVALIIDDICQQGFRPT